jgi:tRNA pseudouridine38-40 synthase
MQRDAVSAAGFARYVRAITAYDGTEFLGFQWQSRGRTVQGALEQALAQVCGIRPDEAPSRVVAAGRTDAGVHALGQVVGFLTVWKHPLAELERALNAVLPEDVAIRQLGPADAEWHPRFSAVRREYRYTVLNWPIRSPLDRRFALHVERPLDLAAMQEGAQVLLGEHDFASFGQPMKARGLRHSGRAGDEPLADQDEMPGSSTVRMVYAAQWTRQQRRDPGEGEWLIFDISGNAFLRGMVRNVVGTLLRVGLGLWPPERVAEVLDRRERGACAPPAPASGLCLMRVHYEEK